MLAIAIISLIAVSFCCIGAKNYPSYEEIHGLFWLTGVIFLAITVIAWWSIHLGVAIPLLVVFGLIYMYSLGD